jgi:hypothetical protein
MGTNLRKFFIRSYHFVDKVLIHSFVFNLVKMGKRGQRRPAKKTGGEPEAENPVDLAAEAMACMFQPIPQDKRNALNGVVEKLLHLVTFWQNKEATVQFDQYTYQ